MFTNSKYIQHFQGKTSEFFCFCLKKKWLFSKNIFPKRLIEEKYVENKYQPYFAPEIESFMSKKWFPKYCPYSCKKEWDRDTKGKLPHNFYELRKIGENESYIWKLIREDSMQEFIAYANQGNFSSKTQISKRGRHCTDRLNIVFWIDSNCQIFANARRRISTINMALCNS